ncbi:MAG: homoserine dehydrogenase [Ruminococcaceae bacterium]|nr:homoserine dehydrogenase [Oscillospiraceae bacterium]
MGKIAIMGFGTVGSGIRDIIKKQNYHAEEKVEIGHILDIRDFSGDEDAKLFTKEFTDILEDSEITVVAEAMGGLHPAYEFTKELLLAGKSVVTSNKELVATYGVELLAIAEEKNVNYMFEASVGGGIPIIRPLATCLAANRVERIVGILNGTTNYILTEMFQKGKTFEDALKDAQNKGYAERNPAADVEGHDACRKIAILSSLAWGKFVDYQDISTEGICEITAEDVQYAEKLGCVIKLIGYAECDENDKVFARVSPMLIPKTCPIAGVDDVFNAIMVTGDSLGDAMFYGRGAGKLPTASAVVADILDCLRHEGTKKHYRSWKVSDVPFMKKTEESRVSYFVRTPEDYDKVKAVFGEVNRIDAAEGTAFITPIETEAVLSEKFRALGNITSRLRMLDA